MTFRLRQARGDVVVNISSLPATQLSRAADIMRRVYQAKLSMGTHLLLSGPGSHLGRFEVGPEDCLVATTCSISVNGVLLAEGIPTTNRFGGLLQISEGQPTRFLQIINYEGTTLDPLEIFIKGQMTDVTSAAQNGSGVVGASFREIPAQAAETARRLSSRMERAGLGGVLLVGRPGQPLLEVPVSQGRVGLVILGGLNPLAAVEEAGIATKNRAMGTLFPFQDLKYFEESLNF
jgi:repressor of nif and glnA expression